MKIVYNNIIPFKGFSAINLFGILFIRRGVRVNKYLVNHEAIHSQQMKELGYVFFYVIYLLEWIYRLCKSRFDNYIAYHSISFEREAYANELNLDYISSRKRYAMWRKL